MWVVVVAGSHRIVEPVGVVDNHIEAERAVDNQSAEFRIAEHRIEVDCNSVEVVDMFEWAVERVSQVVADKSAEKN